MNEKGRKWDGHKKARHIQQSSNPIINDRPRRFTF